MNKQTLKQIQDAIERATQALERLEQAIDSADNLKIGARLYELKQALDEATREAHEANSRYHLAPAGKSGFAMVDRTTNEVKTFINYIPDRR